MRVRNNRGKNSVTFIFGERTNAAKVRKLRAFRGSQIKYLNYKEKLPGGGSKIPQKVILFYKIGYSKSTRYRYKKRTGIDLPQYFYNSEPSPPDMSITPLNVLNFAADSLEAYEDKFEEMIEDKYDDDRDIYNIRELTIAYFW